MKKLFGLGAALGLALFAACGGAPVATSTPGGGTTGQGGANVGTIALKNTSHYDIYSIQLSAANAHSWGANLIEGDALLHGESAQLAVFDCQKYDLRMVDDENVECVIPNIDLCFEDKAWDLDDSDLAMCATGWAD
ncbi:MAG TPA: hypothetical protein VFQ53_23055 [Kofleriaceae bacterium]|nr:hypothetical protein [Kofleriaceae bacterium]